MVDFEAEVNGKAVGTSPVAGVARGAADIGGDLLELAELQALLAKADALAAAKASQRPAGMLVLGVCGALASLPVITIGLALMLDDLTELNAWQSHLLMGCAVALAAIAVIYFAIRALRKAALHFQRSADELAKNVAWAKVVTRTFGRSGR